MCIIGMHTIIKCVRATIRSLRMQLLLPLKTQLSRARTTISWGYAVEKYVWMASTFSALKDQSYEWQLK